MARSGLYSCFFIKKIVGCTSWQGPADAIYCAHRPDKDMDIRQGFGTVLAAFTSLSAGASLGQYGPIVHMGALIGGFLKSTTCLQFIYQMTFFWDAALLLLFLLVFKLPLLV